MEDGWKMIGVSGTAGVGLPGIAVLKSEEHWTSHSVPGIKSQQTAVQSSWTADTTVRWCKATGIAVEKSASHEKLQSMSPSASLTEQVSWHAPVLAGATGRWCKATGIAVEKSASHEKLQSMSPSASLTEQVSWHAPVLADTTDDLVKVALAFDVTVDVTVDLKVDVYVDVAGIFVEEV